MTLPSAFRHNWHPCSQMKDYEHFPEINIKKARGSYLYLNNGHKLLDCISSWWCKALGHNHPRIKRAVKKQADQFEHVIFANTTHDKAIALGIKLATLTKNLLKAFAI